MRNRGALHSRLEMLENKLINPIDRKVSQLNQWERAAYERWRDECKKQFRDAETTPGRYFEQLRNGELTRPKLPHHVSRKIFKPLPELPEGSSGNEMREIWERFKGGER